MDMLERLLGHDRFTTSLVLDMCESLTDEQLDQSFDVGRGSLRDGLSHMIFVVELWTNLMEGKSPGPRPMLQSLSEMMQDHARNCPAFAAVARRMANEQRLDETFRDHHGHLQSIGATILQVAMHNQQHRIEAFHILQRLGVSTDADGGPQEWEHMTGLIIDR